jgi:vacuolar-type H+-ATPase subunit I/STV1
MSKKIDIRGIFSDHYNTLVDYADGRRNYLDLLVQFLVPGIAASLYWYYAPSLKDGVGQSIDQAIVAAFAIFTALLFNLQIMMMGLLSSHSEGNFGQESENEALQKRKAAEKKEFIRQIFYNISYAILVAISLVSISILLVFFDLTESFPFKILEMYLVAHFLLVGLMVLKRTHSLFTHF